MIQSMTGFGKATLQLPTKKITVEPVETFEDIEDIKPKAKATRKPKKEIIIEDLTPVIEPVEDIKPVEKI